MLPLKSDESVEASEDGMPTNRELELLNSVYATLSIDSYDFYTPEQRAGVKAKADKIASVIARGRKKRYVM